MERDAVMLLFGESCGKIIQLPRFESIARLRERYSQTFVGQIVKEGALGKKVPLEIVPRQNSCSPKSDLFDSPDTGKVQECILKHFGGDN